MINITSTKTSNILNVKINATMKNTDNKKNIKNANLIIIKIYLRFVISCLTYY